MKLFAAKRLSALYPSRQKGQLMGEHLLQSLISSNKHLQSDWGTGVVMLTTSECMKMQGLILMLCTTKPVL